MGVGIRGICVPGSGGDSGHRRHTGAGTESKVNNIVCPHVGGAYGHVLSETQLTLLLAKSGGWAFCEQSVFPTSLTLPPGELVLIRNRQEAGAEPLPARLCWMNLSAYKETFLCLRVQLRFNSPRTWLSAVVAHPTVGHCSETVLQLETRFCLVWACILVPFPTTVMDTVTETTEESLALAPNSGVQPITRQLATMHLKSRGTESRRLVFSSFFFKFGQAVRVSLPTSVNLV